MDSDSEPIPVGEATELGRLLFVLDAPKSKERVVVDNVVMMEIGRRVIREWRDVLMALKDR